MLKGLVGGALIGVAATMYGLVAGKPAGISGIVAGALLERKERGSRATFVAGLILAGMAAAVALGLPTAPPRPSAILAVGGLLVGFGTRLGGGCTSGHGVGGLARFSPASAVAVATFVATGAATVALLRVMGL